MSKIITVILFAAFLVVSTARAEAAWDAYFVRNSLSSQQMLASAIERNDRSTLKVEAGHLVRILGNEGVPETISVSAFVNFLRSPRVFEVSCQEFNVRGTRMYRVWTDGVQTDGTWSRPCYQGERWLAYKDSAGRTIPFLSLSCGNPLRVPPPPAIVVEECMELVVKTNGALPSGIRAQVLYWGGRAVTGCGLRPIDCFCQPVFGPPTGAYYAPVVNGVIRLPREMVAHLATLCVYLPGFVASDGTHEDKVIQNGLAAQARSHAQAGVLRVLGETEWLGFITRAKF